ncbi:MAG: DUF1343 domain-containing protein [Spirochaetia bacterium]|nr:DUF1343 domain-containing protein [Spirochaetia bacterium]
MSKSKQQRASVVLGLENFLDDTRRYNKRYGLATNSAAITSSGIPSWKAFIEHGIIPACLFGPEHGFRGAAQDAVGLDDEVFRGIPAYSLYGKRLRPEPWMLESLDALVFDMQDVGCRYYTYLYTLAYIMEVCEKVGTPLIVLDRPNPIGGSKIEGSPISKEAESFVGGYGLPPRYGMTIGEFALYLKGEYYPNCELEIVKMSGWNSRIAWEGTNLPWPLPSPNLPTLSCAELYPGTCLVEGTWLSEGRGTSRPFEIIGAPFIDGEALREQLAAFELPGVVFISLFFSPSASKYKGEPCEGVLISLTDRQALRSLDTGITLVHTIHRMYPDKFRWREDWDDKSLSFFDKLAGGTTLRCMITSGAPLEDCLEFAHRDESQFLRIRGKYLIYGAQKA